MGIDLFSLIKINISKQKFCRENVCKDTTKSINIPNIKIIFNMEEKHKVEILGKKDLSKRHEISIH